MKEIDYVRATNLAKLRTIGFILRDILPGDECGVDKRDYQQATIINNRLMDNLRDKVSVTE